MSILFENGCFKLDTANTTYSMQIAEYGFLMHGHYGAKISDFNLRYIYPGLERSYCTSPYEDKDMHFRLDDVPQEYSSYGISDFRTTALRIKQADGSRAADMRYVSHEIIQGALYPEKLPHATENGEDGIETLKIVTKDRATDLFVELIFTVYEKMDVITRYQRVINRSNDVIFVEKAASMQLDLPDMGYDFIRLCGAWAKERHEVRTPITNGTQGFVSRRGTSSHQTNPFFSLCRPETTQTVGEAYGFHLVYSGNHKIEIETTQYNAVRVLMGIGDEGFSWQLSKDGVFTTPQVLMTYSGEGLGKMSKQFHRFIRRHIFRPQWFNSRRPLLINNWEATYCNFNEDILVDLAKTASKLGIEMLVMDDGWFGHREDDKTSLGDWVPYKKRLANGLKPLADRINEAGLKFGLWMEPEMISEDSELYRNHPDWVLRIPGREMSIGRNQHVLDLVNDEVKEYIISVMTDILSGANIEYLKWDMNRYLTEVYSATLGRDNQGEAYHRYVLAVYDILDRLTTRFPNLLIEHCSGGGGRFDTGMLYYSPQIWTSDDTDPAERVPIQLGTAMAYPITSMGSHFSASPNHQTTRQSSFDARANVAFCGTFGYELDINKLTQEEQETIKAQCAFYKEHYNLINYGTFHRLEYVPGERAAWCFVSDDKKEILLFHIQLAAGANDADRLLRLPCAKAGLKYTEQTTGQQYFGDTLQHVGVCVPYIPGERRAFNLYFKA